MKITHGTASLAVCLALAWSLGACTGENPNYCKTQEDCEAPGTYCGPSNTCLPTEAGVPDGGQPKDGPTPDKPDEPQPNGVACQGKDECKSGFCVDGYCCAGACDGLCQSCAVPGKEGECQAALKNTDLRGDCAGEKTCGGTCNGSGQCTFTAAGESCDSQTCDTGVLTLHKCDGQGQCKPETQSCGGYDCASKTGCKSSCSSPQDCISPAACDTADNTCKAQQINGSPCGTNGDLCKSGFCVDGVCCQTNSCPECQTCNASGQAGTCQAVANGLTCGSGKTCNAGTAKTEACDGGSCKATNTTCAPFTCNSGGTDCAASCSDDSACASTAYCNKASGKCEAKKGNGVTCVAGNECSSGTCTSKEKVCCDTACGGVCETCAGKTKCSPKQLATPCGTDTCVDSATSSTATQYMCNLSGQCQTFPNACGPFKCDPSGAPSCATSCSAHSDCHSLVCQQWDPLAANNNKCIAEAQICYVKASATAPGDGSKALPHPTISQCLAKSAAVVAVDDGRYEEDLTFKVKTLLVGYQSASTLGVPQNPANTNVLIVPTTKAVSATTNNTVQLVGVQILGDPSYPSVGSLLELITNKRFELYASIVGSARGLGVYVKDSTLKLSDVGMGASVGRMINSENSTLEVDRVTILFNQSLAIRMEQGTLKGQYLDISGCTGGGLQAWDVAVSLNRARAFNNQGVGFAFNSNSTGWLTNFEAANNSSYGLSLSGTTGFKATWLTLTKNNGSNEDVVCGTSTQIANSIVWDGLTAWSGGCLFSHSNLSDTQPGNYNMSHDPVFINATLAAPDLRLASTSPCIDAANDNVATIPAVGISQDLDGKPRFVKIKSNSSSSDIGAYERQTP